MKPLNKEIIISEIPDHGRFGIVRKHDTHTGIDLYCDEGETVLVMEDGIIINIGKFTGPEVGSPWWNDTYAVTIESKSGVILYGELSKPWVYKGMEVKTGNSIGKVKQVLKVDKGLPMTMLHLELYKHGYKGLGEWWTDEKPEELLNIEEIL